MISKNVENMIPKIQQFLMKIATMMLNLEDLLHRKVDMVEASRLLSFALDSVNNDKFLIYERKS